MIFFRVFHFSPIPCACLIFPHVPIEFYQNIKTWYIQKSPFLSFMLFYNDFFIQYLFITFSIYLIFKSISGLFINQSLYSSKSLLDCQVYLSLFKYIVFSFPMHNSKRFTIHDPTKTASSPYFSMLARVFQGFCANMFLPLDTKKAFSSFPLPAPFLQGQMLQNCYY